MFPDLTDEPETDAWKRYEEGREEFVASIIRPLSRGWGDSTALLAKAESWLANETDTEIRKILIADIASALGCGGDVERSWQWSLRGVDEAPEDPHSYSHLAMWHFIGVYGHPETVDLAKALEYNALAVEKARKAKAWRRSMLHDRCRIATAAGRFDIVEEAMREILSIWPNPEDDDIPMFEWDWLKDVPAGALDANLMSDYQAVIDRVLANRARRQAGQAKDDAP